ncbi:hypothetical protein LTR10_021121 [Elasticomyces elasticus]|uniref:Uncharacterized protein n=1 Tax=Exophiala sideris TaxID=1016849 RepID=A0ABR0JSS6_9EURO|nr:hypothetical protein LTR10_021121 [Elasticomyces elasticus]KAK5040339.1 hypothetical protein LTS07_000837 [Exophiala sideris]KAK5043235.1 hypothetical protein LTR13_001006 [Exophiala sideris]KAK5068717.1 hypothetical protein LTR69_000838 [Exophiala sideris]KAK5186315.1 hypothetical protein LTR44_001371 [Eurotiomycetes sp. CCFEE 6388]
MEPECPPEEFQPSSPGLLDGYFSQQSVPLMTLDSGDISRLIQQLEADRKAYLSTFEKVHETLNQALNGQSSGPDLTSDTLVGRVLSQPLVASPTTSPLKISERGFGDRPLSSSTGSHQTRKGTFILERHQTHNLKGSIFTGDGSSDSEDDESFFAQEILPSRDFSEPDLVEHLKTHPWDIYSKYILQDLLRNINLLENGIFLKDRHHHSDANHHHADIYHVSTDGAPLRLSRGDSDDGPLAVWEALKNVNSDGTRDHQAVGRIIVVREPPSSLFAALHLTMKEYFDMDSIYRMLIDDETPTKAITKGYLQQDHRRQRSIVFVFKYHTIIGESRAPLPWQNHDDYEKTQEDSVPLSTCSSVVALSLAGRPSHSLRRNSRKRKSIVGNIYDPFAPWHVLSIQCFPDWNHNVDVHATDHHYVNGPDAFLATILGEYRDAIKRFKEVLSSIQRLATPPNKSIFDSALRDELLFENDKYTYSRRYFWAAQTLGLLSNEIKAMIAAYKETFTEDVWSGEHKTLFPGTKEQSPRYNNWRKKLVHTQRQFEKEIVRLEEVLTMFQQQQKEIRGLREWLFSGTSVLESREAVNMAKIAVEQGYNIRLLTLVTLFYLPLTFVTSIYGMTNMPTDHSYFPFAVTCIGICIPTYLLILVVNNPDNVRAIVANAGILFTRVSSCAAPKRSERLKKKILQQSEEKRPTVRKAPTHASLEARLSHDLTSDMSIRGTQGFLHTTTRRMSQSIHSHLPGVGRRATQKPTTEVDHGLPTWQEEIGEHPSRFRQHSSTIKFEEPHYAPTRRRTSELDAESHYGPTRTETALSEGTTLQELDRSNTDPPPTSRSVSPSRQERNGTPTLPPTATVSLRPIRERGLSPRNPHQKSLLRKLSDRFSTLQDSPEASESGRLGPEESV